MQEFGIAAVTLAAAFFGAFAVTPLVIRVAWRLMALDRPEGRKQHAAPIPRLGGIGIVVGFAAGVIAALWASGYRGNLASADRYWWIGWIFAIALLFVCGLIDDIRGLGALTKLVVQLAAALAVYEAGFRIEALQIFGGSPLSLGAFSLPATLIWVVAITNAVNLIDGLDGLAAGVGFLVTATVGAISYQLEIFSVTVIALALAGSLLGFLPYNFSPAKIFMGDSGSQVLGLTLAVISIRGLQKSTTAVAILAPVLVLGLPIVDTILVLLRRTWREGVTPSPSDGGRRERFLAHLGRSAALFRADREHIHHNLLELGLSHRGALLLLYALASAFCLAAFAHVAVRDPSLAIVMGIALAVAVTLLKLMAVRRRTYQAPRVMQSIATGDQADGEPNSRADAQKKGPGAKAPGRIRRGEC